MSVWDDAPTLDEFLCIELKQGSIFIAVIGIAYGFVGFVLFLSFIINYSDWKTLYEKKFDELVYFGSIFLIIALLFLASLVLLLGVLRGLELLIQIYLWCALAHLCLNCLINLCLCLYCLCANSCFWYQPHGSIVVLILLTIFYSLLWGYFIIIVNSFRMLS